MPDPGSETDLDAQQAGADRDAARARRMHERTGEIELLISGALLFGLIRVPGYLDGAVDVFALRLSESQFMLGFMLSFYMKLIVLTLIVSFGLHLITRAYWVGLLGLDSVFPKGIAWDRINYGPVSQKAYRANVPLIPAMARRADDLGSSIFSFACWIIVVFAFSIVAGSFVGGIWYGIKATVWPEADTAVFLVMIVLLALIPSVAMTADKLFGEHLDPEGLPARMIRWIVLAWYRTSAGPLFMPIQLTLFSRVPKRVMWTIFLGVFGSLLVGYLGAEALRAGAFELSPSALLPTRPGPQSVNAAHFATTRAPSGRGPYIQSDIIEGPYVKLTIPLVPSRLAERVEGACPGFEPGGRVGVVSGSSRRDLADVGYERELLVCLGRVWSLRMDGAPISPEWDLAWTDSFGASSIVTYLPTSRLDSGAHVLEVSELPALESDAERAKREARGDEPQLPRIDYIRFRR